VLLVSTIDKHGMPHNSCKGIVEIEPGGKVYLLDLYQKKTLTNLKNNPKISISAFDEHKFRGFCLKGTGKIVRQDKLSTKILKAWEDRITSRITRRLIRNIHEEKGHSRHPEIMMPKPEYMIELEVREIVDLTPQHLK